ncbi:hypothetical protein EJV47_24155 [Hymenobacter gummosus]|uniref:Uncharacterized protein n=1 Tax=Hymenobacter gummosus TaxID=1776032 RepID=A0A431TWG2_9BACT|nr:hypothetical protein [Hymenobacter gummosus]RTQ45926.1 hypothetical protein EJV47_24155 [Hymenobacter gummosus]
MEFLFGFVFTLIKISLQAAVYATLLLGLALGLTRIWPASWLARRAQRPWQLWQSTCLLLAGLLFAFSFTYWGSHGLGDYSRIPLGHSEAVEENNGLDAYFEPSVPVDRPGDQAHLANFQVAAEVLCAAYDDGSYFTYDLASKDYQTFATGADYNAHARRRGLPLAEQFEPFSAHYRRFWGGWRFWLLA